jgi:hypothetical protein
VKDKLSGDKLRLDLYFPIRVGLISDLHQGASRAVCPAKYQDKEGNVILPNEIQQCLRKLWVRNIQQFNALHVQSVFVVGDVFAAQNPLEAGHYITVYEKPNQIRMAVDLLTELWNGLEKKPVFLVWSGTGYHESRKGEADMHEQLCILLNRNGIPAVYMQDQSYVELSGALDYESKKPRIRRIFISHEAPTGLVYPATLMSRDITWSLMGRGTGDTLPVDAIIRAHLHNWLHVDHGGVHAVQLPCWMAHTPYKQTIKYFFKLQPRIGGAAMLMDQFGRLQFWGGSYPFGFNKAEYERIHRLSVTNVGLNPNAKDFLESVLPTLTPQDSVNVKTRKDGEVISE